MHSVCSIIGPTRTDDERCENCTYKYLFMERFCRSISNGSRSQKYKLVHLLKNKVFNLVLRSLYGGHHSEQIL